MRQRAYLAAFVLVILVIVSAAFFGGRLLLRSLRQEFAPAQTWAPPELTVTRLPGQAVATPTALASGPRPTATRAPVTPALPVASPPATAAPLPTRAPEPVVTLPPSATATPTATAAVAQQWDFTLARPVRHSAGDCPGNYILGQVSDRGGNPLPGVNLWLVDEYGNQTATTTKTAASDAGRYDFPLFGVPRRFFLTVVDAAGHPISPQVEIAFGLGASAAAPCHWADWRGR